MKEVIGAHSNTVAHPAVSGVFPTYSVTPACATTMSSLHPAYTQHSFLTVLSLHPSVLPHLLQELLTFPFLPASPPVFSLIHKQYNSWK